MPGPLTRIIRGQAHARHPRPHTPGVCFCCGRPVTTTRRLASGLVVFLCPGPCPDRAKG